MKQFNLQRKNKDLINLNPIQTGGKLTSAARRALIEFGDGYSICDFCAGRLDKIENPNIREFVHKDLPDFLGADVARITNGAREGVFIILRAITKPKDTIVVDANRHYTTILAAETQGLKVVEVPSSKGAEYKINVRDYEPLIKKHKPPLIVLTYPDGNYGNLTDAKELGRIAKKYKVPYLINGAYAIGRMPISMEQLGADFIVGSGHKSMASSGPIGILGMSKKWEDVVLKKSSVYLEKETELLGCTARGAAMATLLASFPEVVERVKNWDKEIEKARWFSVEMEKLGMEQIGDKPHNHDLMFFKSEPLYKISLKHPRGRFFLYNELKTRGIVGIKQGLTKNFKISTFGISNQDLKKVIAAFKEILEI